MLSKAEKDEEAKWRIKHDVKTLKEALEIVNNKNRLEKAQEFAKKEKKKLELIEDVSYLKKIGLE